MTSQQKAVGFPFRSRKSAALNAGRRLGEAPDEEKVARRVASQRRKGNPTAFCELTSFLMYRWLRDIFRKLLYRIQRVEQCGFAVFGFTGFAEPGDGFEQFGSLPVGVCGG